MKKSPAQIRSERTRNPGTSCSQKLIIAPLWPMYDDNLGTLVRTVDALNACIAVPRNNTTKLALRKGDTIGLDKVCLHWVKDPGNWLANMRSDNYKIIGVELADDAISLKNLEPTYKRTVIVLGHEVRGIPEEMWRYFHDVVEIPMRGCGSSLNVSVAGSLVAYKIAGLV